MFIIDQEEEKVVVPVKENTEETTEKDETQEPVEETQPDEPETEAVEEEKEVEPVEENAEETKEKNETKEPVEETQPNESKAEAVEEEKEVEPVEENTEEITEKEETKEPVEETQPDEAKVEVVEEEEATQEVAEPEIEEPAKEPKTPEEDMMELMDQHFAKFKEGEIIDGYVVSVDERAVLIDIGFKSESPISIKEFNPTDLPKIGTPIKVYIDSVEDISGRIKLSKKKADFYLNLKELQRLMEEDETVNGVLRRRVKGGMIAEIMGLEAFLPGSQIS
ncbi:MAG: S1 RNA-binding domain-containing protein, partial [Candidatus Stygibacter frigidus]|nr:S1 RNA-binding domain-containing protein [Candidatus Stygibacter frigidus]